MTTTTIDIQGLIDAGHLDLDDVFSTADWIREDVIASPTVCCYGPDGDSSGKVDIWLERAEEFGITAWRWTEDESGESGEVYLSHFAAIEAAEAHAEEIEEFPNVDSIVDEIVETGYFGSATADEIKALCESACLHSQGFYLLRRGELPHPLGSAWTTNGYLQCEYITLDATHDDVSAAADTLLRAIRNPEGD